MLYFLLLSLSENTTGNGYKQEMQQRQAATRATRRNTLQHDGQTATTATRNIQHSTRNGPQLQLATAATRATCDHTSKEVYGPNALQSLQFCTLQHLQHVAKLLQMLQALQIGNILQIGD
jgi:hypothetical protein